MLTEQQAKSLEEGSVVWHDASDRFSNEKKKELKEYEVSKIGRKWIYAKRGYHEIQFDFLGQVKTEYGSGTQVWLSLGDYEQHRNVQNKWQELRRVTDSSCAPKGIDIDLLERMIMDIKCANTKVSDD